MPKSPYDLNKLTSERYLKLYNRAYGVEQVIFRFATVYGPRQRLSPEWHPVVMEFCTKLLKRAAPIINGTGEQTRDFIFVEDIVGALVKVLSVEEAVNETMILGTNTETSINELYNLICDILNVKIKPKRGPKRFGDIPRMRYDCRKVERILGWKAKTSLANGITKILVLLSDAD